MSLFDWIETGFNIGNVKSGGEAPGVKEFEKDFSGSFSVTFGDDLSSIILGGQHTHIYGDSFQFTIDWEALLEGIASQIPGVGHVLFGGIGGALLNGAGGYTNMVFGRTAALAYGETIDIKRATSATVSGKNKVWDWFAHGHAAFSLSELAVDPADAQHAGQQSSIDDKISIGIGILSAVMALTALTIEMVAALKFKTGDPLGDLEAEFQALKAEVHHQPIALSPPQEGPAGMGSLLKTLSWTITSRFAGVIIQIELIGQQMRDAVSAIPTVEAQLRILRDNLDAATHDLDALRLRADQAEVAAARSAARLENAAGDIGRAFAMAFSAAEAADRAQTSAANNLRHMSVDEWSVAADGNVEITSVGQRLYIGAEGDQSSLLVNAVKTASFACGPTWLSLDGGRGGGDAVPRIMMNPGSEGVVSIAAGLPEQGPMVLIEPEQILIRLGVPDGGSAIKMTPESILLSVGIPGEGSSIYLTPEAITFKVGECTKTLSAEGILEVLAEVTRELTAEGHNLTAAETEFNVGVEGEAKEGPTKAEEVEGGTLENETLGADATDAMKNEAAAIKITE